MSLERIRRRNAYLRDTGKLPGSIPGRASPIPRATSPKVLTISLPCIHEGPILEYCKSRHGPLGDARHVRDCELHDRCTRGMVSHLVTACVKCPDYKTEEIKTKTDDGTSTPTEPESAPSPVVKASAPTCNKMSRIRTLPPPAPTILPSGKREEMDSLPDDQRREKRWKRPPTWMYGVTTVPERRAELLPRTLASLKNGGFESPILFVDGDHDYKSWHDEFNLPCVMRYPRLRVFGNWALALAELYLRNSHADYYAIFQDDFTTSKNLKTYIESVQFPTKGYLNLYTFPKNQKLAGTRIGFYPSNQKGKGAVALVFNIEGVQMLLQHNHMIKRVRDLVRGHKFVDGSIVETMRQEGWTEYVHNPSLVQHYGFISTTGNPKHPQATSFKGEDFDLMTLLDKSHK